LVQIAILKYLKRLNEGVKIKNPKAYLHIILKNTFIKQKISHDKLKNELNIYHNDDSKIMD